MRTCRRERGLGAVAAVVHRNADLCTQLGLRHDAALEQAHGEAQRPLLEVGRGVVDALGERLDRPPHRVPSTFPHVLGADHVDHRDSLALPLRKGALGVGDEDGVRVVAEVRDAEAAHVVRAGRVRPAVAELGHRGTAVPAGKG